jgi:hypothetical protein
MNRQSFQAYREKILSLIKISYSKNSLVTFDEEVKEHYDTDPNKQSTIIPFKKIR